METENQEVLRIIREGVHQIRQSVTVPLPIAQHDALDAVNAKLSALAKEAETSGFSKQTVAQAAKLDAPGYELLADVLTRAFSQASAGKGKERHAADGERFEDQVMQEGARRFGVGALLFQAFKKSEESQRLPLDRGVNELLGAIVYLAGAVICREKNKT